MAVAENFDTGLCPVADDPRLSELEVGRIWISPWSYSGQAEGARDRFPARSLYVETFWLSTLGPTTTWVMRRIALELESNPDGFWLSSKEWAQWLGVSDSTTVKSPIVSSVFRSIRFGVTRLVEAAGPVENPRVLALGQRPSTSLVAKINLGHVVLEAKSRFLLLAQRQVSRLPVHLHELHRRFETE